MANIDVIESKLKDQSEMMVGILSRVGGIEKALGEIAVQNNKLVNQDVKITAIGKKLDRLLATDGVISKIVSHQAKCPYDLVKTNERKIDTLEKICAACPVENIKSNIKGMWAAIVFMGLIVAGIFAAVIDAIKGA